MDPIYLDSNATTPLLPAVWEAMRPYLTEVHGNPASAHRFGRQARQGIESAREQLADLLGARGPDEVAFTSGATEANNLALFALAGEQPARLIASPIGHPSVREPLRQFGPTGFTFDFLPVSPSGSVCVDDLPALVAPETRLVTVMLANHETGAVQPIRELVEALAGTNIAFHCDAVQAVGKLPVAFRALGVTSLSLSAHK